MKKIFSLFAAVLFAGSMFAADATMAAGTNSSACTVNGNDGIKCGTSKNAGDMTITVGAGATKLTVYAAAWKGVNGASIAIAAPEGVTANPASLAINPDDGISNNSPFTLSGNADSFIFEVSLAGVSAETVLTLSCAKRFVVWGATYDTGEGPEPVLADGYYLVGSFNEWTPANGYKFAANTETEGEWYLSKVLSVGDEFKVRQVEGGEATVWFPAEAGNYVVDALHAGANSRHIYFRPDYQGGDDWHAHCIFVERNPINLGEKTIAEFLELKNFKDTCILKGTVANIVMDKDDPTIYNKYGNFDIVDETGSLYVYGLLTADGQAQKFREMGVDEGDILTIKAIYTEYKGNPQAQNAIYVSHIEGGTTAVDNTEVNAKAVKFFENGQLVIIKNGVKYNATGAIVK